MPLLILDMSTLTLDDLDTRKDAVATVSRSPQIVLEGFREQQWNERSGYPHRAPRYTPSTFTNPAISSRCRRARRMGGVSPQPTSTKKLYSHGRPRTGRDSILLRSRSRSAKTLSALNKAPGTLRREKASEVLSAPGAIFFRLRMRKKRV